MVTECTVVYTAVAPGPQCRSIVTLNDDDYVCYGKKAPPPSECSSEVCFIEMMINSILTSLTWLNGAVIVYAYGADPPCCICIPIAAPVTYN